MQMFLLSFYREGNRNLEKLNDLFKFIQKLSKRSRIQIQVLTKKKIKKKVCSWLLPGYLDSLHFR